MAKKKNPNDYLVAIEMIRTVKELAQDPLISSLYAWYWIQKKSGLGLDDRALLRAGVIDINGARANVDNSIVMGALDRVTSLAGDLAKGLGLAAASTAAPEIAAIAGASESLTPKKKRTTGDAATVGDMTVKEAIQKGLLTKAFDE